MGNLWEIVVKPAQALLAPNSTCTGFGISPEGIEQNPVVYELMFELVWRNPVQLASGDFNLTNWLQLYADRRYGFDSSTAASRVAGNVWDRLSHTLYGFADKDGTTPITLKAYSLSRLPSLSTVTTADGAVAAGTAQAWIELAKVFNNKSHPGLMYDLVDLGRECINEALEQLHVLFTLEYTKAIATKHASPDAAATLQTLGEHMLRLVKTLDDLLGTNSNFLLSTWLNRARTVAPATEETQFEFTARNQLMMWGPSPEIGPTADYAMKHWQGLV
eukprot:m.53082 g.53082  ORF g.53082 m.53082 type:complete len:275 (-) comp21707_c0_seq1:120-944(-)